jgi:hypothetical protein
MEKERKSAKDWYIAATHWLTASFVMPLIFSFVGGIAMGLLGIENQITIWIMSLVLAIVGVYVGIIYSVKFLKKTYIIKDKMAVVKLSTIIAICFSIIGLGASLYSVELEKIVFSGYEFFLNIISSCIIIVFILSKKYITAIDANNI